MADRVPKLPWWMRLKFWWIRRSYEAGYRDCRKLYLRALGRITSHREKP